MLYDKRWDKPDPVHDGFIAFLRSKPANKGYTYHVFTRCACAQYCRSTRSFWMWVWPPRYFAQCAFEREVWNRFDHVAGYHPHTFGALLQRLK